MLLTRFYRNVKLYRNVKRFQGGLVFKAHRLLYHSTLGFRVIKKKKKDHQSRAGGPVSPPSSRQSLIL